MAPQFWVSKVSKELCFVKILAFSSNEIDESDDLSVK